VVRLTQQKLEKENTDKKKWDEGEYFRDENV